jgi:hypothetical protein
MKSYTDLEQSKKLANILPTESADMFYCYGMDIHTKKWDYDIVPTIIDTSNQIDIGDIPCWGLAALLSLIKDKCGYFEFVYLKRTFDGRANPLEDVYRLSTDVYDVYNKEAVDACVEMIEKLHEQKLL